MRYARAEAHDMARRAILGAGASEAVAHALADATVAAELSGRAPVGFAHLLDYLDGFSTGRIARDALPALRFPAPAIVQADAHGGIAQLGFDLAFDALREAAGTCGIAVFAQRNSYTAGELGYYTRRLADAGLVAFAASNGPALMAPAASAAPAYGTNPLSFAAPLAGHPPLVIDQATSATAFVNVRQAAERHEPIPAGWAVDAHGNPTTDAGQAMKGMLLAFGGTRGANIALMVEVLAAGLTGANWSLDAPSFASGTQSPGIGLFVLAVKPDLLAPDFATRLAEQADRLAASGVHIPGGKPAAVDIDLTASLVAAIERYATSG